MNNIAQILMVESSVPHLASLPVALVRTSPVVKYHAYDVSCAISSTPFPQPLYYFSSLIILDHIFAAIFSLPFLHPISSPIHLSPERLSFKKKTKTKKQKKRVQLTLEQHGLTMQLYLHEDFVQ